MQLALEDFMAEQKALEERMAAFESQWQELKGRLSEERKLRKSAERKARTLREQLDYARQERFGDRHQRVRKKTESGGSEKLEPDREDEKDGFDGADHHCSVKMNKLFYKYSFGDLHYHYQVILH